MNYDRIILELMDRVAALEQEVEKLKQEKQMNTLDIPVNESQKKEELERGNSKKPTGRDSTKYILDNKKYGKNRLVLALVKKYADTNPGISAKELMEVFDKSLQGSLGVVRILEEVQKRYDDSDIRFFTAPDEIIHTSTQD